MLFPVRMRGPWVAAAIALALGAPTVRAQEGTERLSLHGSLNLGYGKSDGLGVFGIDKNGTSDYRAVAMQVSYKLDSKNRVVVQLLHRAFGTSPLQSVEPSIFPIWAFYERKAGAYTVKLGRNPMPRGIFNEVRFIGTLLPFFRAAPATYGETMENIDGAVVSRSFDLADSWGLDANVMGGAFDIKAVYPDANGQSAVVQFRARNAFGSQLWLKTPVSGLRLGAFATSFEYAPSVTVPNAPSRTVASTMSVDGDFDHWFGRSEYSRFDAKDNGNAIGKTAFHSYYTQAGIKLTEKITIASEYAVTSNLITLPQPFPPVRIQTFDDLAGAINLSPSANVKFKFELHRNTGFTFDTPVPTLIPPTAPPFVMTVAPKSRANYAIFSIAVSF